MSFNISLSFNTARRLRDKERELSRLFELPSERLASELMSLSRQCAKDGETFIEGGMSRLMKGYEGNFLRNLIPELAFRLGYRDFAKDERTDPSFQVDDYALRLKTGVYLQNISPRILKVNESNAWALLTNEHVNGNPVAIAMDRICPPKPEIDHDDYLATYMREIAARRKMPGRSVWTPGFSAPNPLRYAIVNFIESTGINPDVADSIVGKNPQLSSQLAEHLNREGFQAYLVNLQGLRWPLKKDAHPSLTDLNTGAGDLDNFSHTVIQIGNQYLDITGAQFTGDHAGIRFIGQQQIRTEWKHIKSVAPANQNSHQEEDCGMCLA